tara:strand:+ start:639 stop:755 length:117 start_codon:yes stop_codon:yes gene_type:complete
MMMALRKKWFFISEYLKKNKNALVKHGPDDFVMSLIIK